MLLRVEGRLIYATLIASVGIIGLAAIAAAVGGVRKSDNDLYLKHAFGIAISAAGNIFVGDNFSRIVAVNPRGQPLRSWRVAAQSGLFRLRFTEAGLLEVAAVRPGKLYRFDPNGRLIETQIDRDAYQAFGPTHDFEAIDPFGNTYRIVNANSIIRITPDNREETIVPPAPFLSLPIGVPSIIPAVFGFFSVTVSILALHSWLSHKRAGAA